MKQEFEAVAQGAHVRVHGLLQLEGVGDDLDGPVLELGVLAGLEAEVEVARVFGVDAEGVHAPLRVGFRVGRQPAFWKGKMSVFCFLGNGNLRVGKGNSPVSALLPF